MNEIERIPEGDRQAIADQIRQGPNTDAGGELLMEETFKEIGAGDGPILAEAKAERAEGGGPIADAVEEVEEILSDR